jgi:hypothetical protein
MSDKEVREKLTNAWKAAVTRLLAEGYSPAAVAGTMAVVALSDDVFQDSQLERFLKIVRGDQSSG